MTDWIEVPDAVLPAGMTEGIADEELPGTAAGWLAMRTAAERVVLNAYGASPRHTVARGGGACRDDCVPCGVTALRNALAALAAEASR